MALRKATSKRAPKKKAAAKSKGPRSVKAPRKRKVVLLSGGNPQIAKADGNAPVRAYLDALPGWKRDLGKRLDALIVRTVPEVQKAVKWNSPLYGIAGQGYFLGVHAFTRYLKINFFFGRALRPMPPEPSRDKHARYVNLHEGDELTEQLASWIQQAAARPGWKP